MSINIDQNVIKLKLSYNKRPNIKNKLTIDQITAIEEFNRKIKLIYTMHQDYQNFGELDKDDELLNLNFGLINEIHKTYLPTINKKIFVGKRSINDDSLLLDEQISGIYNLYRLADAVESYVNNFIITKELLVNDQSLGELGEVLSAVQELKSSLGEKPKNAKILIGKNKENTISVENKNKEKDKYKDDKVADLIHKALYTTHDHKINKSEIELIKRDMGDDNFDRLCKHYVIDLEEFTTDDMRKLMIGTYVHPTKSLIKSKFICKIAAMGDIKTLDLTRFKSFADSVDRIKNEEPFSLFSRAVNYLRDRVPYLSYMIKRRGRANDAVINDLEYSSHLQDLSALKNSNKNAIEKKLAHDEYLSKVIGYTNFLDDTIVPIYERDGSYAYYSVLNIIDKEGLSCKMLIPYNYNNSNLECKIVFGGTTDFSSILCDCEVGGAGYQTYKALEPEILTKINTEIGKLKNKMSKKSNISLGSYGHSLGGAYSQYFTSSYVESRVNHIYAKTIDERKTNLEIEKRLNHYAQDNTPNNKNYKEFTKDVINTNLKRIGINKTLRDGLIHDEHIQEIDTFYSSNDSAPAPTALVNNQFKQNLYLLKDKVKMQMASMLLQYDPVTMMGERHLATGVSADLAESNIYQYESKEYSQGLKNTLTVCGYAILREICQRSGFLLPFVGLIPAKEGVDYKEVFESVANNHGKIAYARNKSEKFTVTSNKDLKQHDILISKRVDLLNENYLSTKIVSHVINFCRKIESLANTVLDKVRDLSNRNDMSNKDLQNKIKFNKKFIKYSSYAKDAAVMVVNAYVPSVDLSKYI